MLRHPFRARLVPVWLAIGLAGAGAGCGRRVGPFATPRATLGTLVARAQSGAQDAILECLSAESRASVAELEREAARLAAPVQAVLGPIDDLERQALERFGRDLSGLEVRRQEMDERAGRATLTIAVGQGPVQQLRFLREQDGWKLDLTGELQPARALLDSIERLGDPVRRRLEEIHKGGTPAAASPVSP